MQSSSKEIDRLAADWAAKVHGGEMTPEEQECFDAWLAADMRHLGAYGRVEAGLVRLERLRAIGGSQLRDRMSMSGIRWTRRRVILAGSAAASLAAGMTGLIVWEDRARETFATGVGETKMIPLSDGSVVALNTNSEISVNFTKTARAVHLDRGEAFFTVAKDKKRPFVVAAGDTDVRAVGTRFIVRILPQRPLQIVVQEGVVEVKRRDVKYTVPVRVGAETSTLVPPDAAIVTNTYSQVQIERNLAWQHGRIAFENETLEAAAQEFGRYSDQRIVVDPAVATRTVTGRFASNDPVGFANAVAAALNLRVEIKSDVVMIGP